MKLKFNIFFVGLFIIGFSGCYEKPNFSNIPEISYVGKEKLVIVDELSLAKTDLVTLTIFFRDGDGNLGLNPSDTVLDKFKEFVNGVFNPNSQNYRLTTFIQDTDGQFIPFEVPESTLTDTGTFERLDEDDKRNPIEGTLSDRKSVV